MNIENLIDRYLTYWNQADIEGLVSMYDDTILYHDLPSGDVITFKDIEKYLKNTFAFETNQQLKLQDPIFVEGNSAFIYWVEAFYPTGSEKQVKVNGVELIVFRDHKIISIHDFYDYQRTASDDATESMEGPHSDKMMKLGLDEKQMEQIAREINEFFISHTFFLEPEFNLTVLAKILGYTRNQISYVINHVLGRTFYDLVNTRRIEYVIGQMKEGTNLSILEMAINAGFNSVSGFYTAFKKHTGMTPAQYQRRQAG